MKYIHTHDRHEIEEEICKQAGYILIGKMSVFFTILIVSAIFSLVFLILSDILGGIIAFLFLFLFLYWLAFISAGTVNKYRRKAIKMIVIGLYSKISKYKEVLERKKAKIYNAPEAQTEEGRRQILLDESNPLRDVLMDISELEKDIVNMERVKSILMNMSPQKNPMF